MGDNSNRDATAEFISVDTTAEMIGVDPKTVHTMIADGRLKAYRLGWRVIRLRRDEVIAAFEPFGGAA